MRRALSALHLPGKREPAATWLRPWACMLAMVVAGIAVFEAFLYVFAYPGSGIGLSMMLMPGIVLLYLNSHDLKSAFGQGGPAA
jgi:hypothetical protein